METLMEVVRLAQKEQFTVCFSLHTFAGSNPRQLVQCLQIWRQELPRYGWEQHTYISNTISRTYSIEEACVLITLMTNFPS
jgi:hypothetical protein